MQTLDGHDCWPLVHDSYGSTGLKLTRQETSMTVLLSYITAADQLGHLPCINDSRLQLDSDQFTQSTNVYFAVKYTAILHLYVCLHAVFSLACVLCINCCSLKLDSGCGITLVFTFIACSEVIRSHGCGTHGACLQCMHGSCGNACMQDVHQFAACKSTS